ncbi:MAG: DUF1549 domain-containing protein [Acidobacteria bacterium]|nr:DUF1549 domain-containing protein [Acidobacteriota bacterium]
MTRGRTRLGVLLLGAAVLWGAGDRKYWAFQKPVRPEVPAIESSWIRTPIDAFILEALREKKLTPSPPLDRERLLRRLYLDLTGLPPGPGEVDLFLRDRSPDAYEKTVDRLLASPHYGERWALRWLDVVRYADTNGYEADAERTHAWRYRDYVVRSFNQDKPYDRFVQEQIAGDELWPADKEALIATGFHRCGPVHVVGGNQDKEMSRQEVLTEMTSAIGQVFLGLTVGCARCHNHKFDSIPQADYYRLQAVFAATEGKDIDIATPEEVRAYGQAHLPYVTRLNPITAQLVEIEKPYRAQLREKKMAQLEPKYAEALKIPQEQRNEAQKRLAKDAEDQLKPTWDEILNLVPPADRERRAALRRQMHQIELGQPDPKPAAFAVVNLPEAPPTYILKVGDYKQKLDLVQPGFLSPLSEEGTSVPASAAGRRSALARWLASPEHPLTARVMVNRVWQFRMGTGLVATPNDFGLLGQRPSNPKLLDWLATEFMARNWSVKTIDRMIVLSSVYQQEAADAAAKSKIDPENKLYWRMNRRRLEGETIRDQVLAVAGTLNPRLGGKPVRIPIEREVYDLIFTEGEPDNLWPVTPDRAEHARRSLYLLNKRTVRLPFLMNFDQPDTMTSCPVRPASTHSLQALSLMNSDFMQEQSQALGARLERECGRGDRGCQVRRAYKLALARAPRPAETGMAQNFFARGGLLPDFCLALLNRNEFVYIP